MNKITQDQRRSKVGGLGWRAYINAIQQWILSVST